ncbi:hypothetical protein CLV51_104146 [Chitinophaga niastensis]|uniref:Uncharacterized protein n=1 Tax=Chitinophaga niastensis TaxID=536980 RepID=A0A2P8HGV0_CHINA|nr:hypothetical protein CLV51_104146 [Chitinophaga niastensis]
MCGASLLETVREKSATGAILDFRIMSGDENSSINANKKAVRDMFEQLLKLDRNAFNLYVFTK